MGKKTIIFTGGGTAGHVTPNIALMRRLRGEGINIHYIGTKKGMEREITAAEGYVSYHTISAGKLRRYFSLQNVRDAFSVLRGIGQARRIIKKVRPDVLFSKGGFVSVPAVLAAKGICPCVTHESDYTPGLSNKIASRFCNAVCVSFENTLAFVGQKGVFTGTPIRSELYAGNPSRGRELAGFDDKKPVLMMMGGSLGAQAINDALRSSLDELLSRFNIIHLTGKGKLDPHIIRKGYVQLEYAGDELPDFFAMTDIILARAGANAIFEFLALKKPALLIPLPSSSSRGDQLQNAQYFKTKGFAQVLLQQDLSPDTLVSALNALYDNRDKYIKAMNNAANADGTEAVLKVIKGYLKDE